MATQKGKLFLIPSPISDEGLESISTEVISIIHRLDHFIVERARTARRFVSATKPPRAIEALIFEEMPEDGTDYQEISKLLEPLFNGKDIGLMSEAGLPAIADPGSQFVRFAQKHGIKVIPLSGPSSIMMALMGSGLEGQRFAFHGYLSAKKTELPSQLRFLEQRVIVDDATQIWIEAPYRNKQILEGVEKNISAERMFCIAADLGTEHGFVHTKTVADWKNTGWPDLHKVPTVFLLK